MDLLLLLLGFFAVVFAIEADVLSSFKLQPFWAALGLSVLLNLVSFALLYFAASALLSLLGYETAGLDGLNRQPQVILFLWWFSVVAEGLLLLAFLRKAEPKRILIAAILMNVLSFLFLYGFVEFSH